MLIIKNLTFSYEEKPLLQDISFAVGQGEICTILGESGAGKSTLLKLLYGQYDLNRGHIYYGDKEILGPKFNLIHGDDRIKYVSQESDLMPFTTINDNVGKFLSNFYLKEKEKRISELLSAVGLLDYAGVKVKNLSGGQKQRVALAQALAKQPELLLLDEPFSHIDNFRKEALRRNLFQFLKNNNISCVLATHNKEDVLSFVDKILVLENGKIIASGSPKQLYNNPKLPVVASFFDTYNYLPVRLLSDIDSDKKVIVYAHEIRIQDTSELVVRIEEGYFKGRVYLYRALIGGENVFFESQLKFEKGMQVGISVPDSILQKRLKSVLKEEVKS